MICIALMVLFTAHFGVKVKAYASSDNGIAMASVLSLDGTQLKQFIVADEDDVTQSINYCSSDCVYTLINAKRLGWQNADSKAYETGLVLVGMSSHLLLRPPRTRLLT